MRTVLLVFLFGHALAGPAQRTALIGYYAGDGTDLPGRDLGPLTHVIWCFLQLDGDSIAAIPEAQQAVIRHLVERKAGRPVLKVMLSLGGWGGCATCSEVFGRPEGRRTFARSLHAWLLRTGTDGIDLDWEYPAVQGPPGHAFGPQDREHFTALVLALRDELGPRYEISFAAGGTDECLLNGFEWDRVMPMVDRVNLMSYDLVHGYSTRTGHHTPLYSTPQQPLSVDHGVDVLLELGVPPQKIVIGAAFYSRVFTVTDTIGSGLFRPGSFHHAVSYHALDSMITTARGWRWSFDTIALAPHAFNPGERLFLTGDDRVSVAAKARYVRERGLGGIMFWQLRDDRTRDGLLDVMDANLRDP